MDPDTDLDVTTILRLPDFCFAAWWLKTQCPAGSKALQCRVRRYFPIGRNLRREPLGRLIIRLRCKHCGQPPISIELIDEMDEPGIGRPTFRIRLFGVQASN